jgi:hypothetical protein
MIQYLLVLEGTPRKGLLYSVEFVEFILEDIGWGVVL